MRKVILLPIFLCTTLLFSQYEYEPSNEFPFGRAHPEAPEQVKDFQPMIGECNCKSVLRNPDQTWAEP
ncbi:MAG: hypothetical protein HKP06_09405, partial [Flavobacteriaceae bacterium]|nr:hypothetical protein [Flavobacteriaceae bacterium]